MKLYLRGFLTIGTVISYSLLCLPLAGAVTTSESYGSINCSIALNSDLSYEARFMHLVRDANLADQFIQSTGLIDPMLFSKYYKTQWAKPFPRINQDDLDALLDRLENARKYKKAEIQDAAKKMQHEIKVAFFNPFHSPNRRHAIVHDYVNFLIYSLKYSLNDKSNNPSEGTLFRLAQWEKISQALSPVFGLSSIRPKSTANLFVDRFYQYLRREFVKNEVQNILSKLEAAHYGSYLRMVNLSIFDLLFFRGNKEDFAVMENEKVTKTLNYDHKKWDQRYSSKSAIVTTGISNRQDLVLAMDKIYEIDATVQFVRAQTLDSYKSNDFIRFDRLENQLKRQIEQQNQDAISYWLPHQDHLDMHNRIGHIINDSGMIKFENDWNQFEAHLQSEIGELLQIQKNLIRTRMIANQYDVAILDATINRIDECMLSVQADVMSMQLKRGRRIVRIMSELRQIADEDLTHVASRFDFRERILKALGE